MKYSQVLVIVFCLSLVLVVAGCTDSKTASSENTSAQATEQPTTTTQASIEQTNTAQNVSTPSGQNLTVHFLDVGQGDSILIEYANKSMLIDAGESDQGEVVSDYLHDRGISTLDYVVATHPHSDHIGGMDDILNSFQIKHFVDSGYPYTSKTYENMLTAIDKKNIPFETPKRGDKINFAPSIDVEVLNPGATYYSDDLNQNSIVLKVTDGKVSFIFMGDAGLEAENDIIKADYNVDADILKVGHHGSRSASGATFISAVSPSISVIEVGVGNDYGHPHKEILERLEKVSKVYRTDLNGTMTITTDGSTYTVTTQKTEHKEESKSMSSGSVAYTSTDSTTTQKTVPEETVTSSSAESAVYVSDLNLKDEWVKVSNKGSSPVSLTGWKIEDNGSKHTYTFPSYTLDSSSTLTVYTGGGTNSATELYWGSGSPIWNNDGDTAYLYDSSGKLVSTLEG
jgi:competence protein ComEC